MHSISGIHGDIDLHQKQIIYLTASCTKYSEMTLMNPNLIYKKKKTIKIKLHSHNTIGGKGAERIAEALSKLT